MYFSRSELINLVQSTTENYANLDLLFLLSSSFFAMAKWIGTLMSLNDHFKQKCDIRNPRYNYTDLDYRKPCLVAISRDL